jgi:hypothetical protein
MLDKNSMGMDGFTWFFGIVEDRQDPMNLGRVRVRCFGWHDDDLTSIPTDHLPWAQVITSGTDRQFATPREQDMVFGFFADGRYGQQPFILGIVNGKFAMPNNPGKGFNDLRPQTALETAPRFIQSAQYKTDGSGIKLTEKKQAQRHPNDLELNNPTITGVAFNKPANTVVQQRQNNLDTGVTTAAGQTWSEPKPAYAPVYPYNQVYASESGHVIEVDDTPGHERIAFQHRSGSFIEWYPSGSVVQKITNSRYTVIMGDDNLHVMGKCRITVSGDAFIKVVGDTNLEADGDLNVGVAGDGNFTVGGDFNLKAGGGVNIQAAGGDMNLKGTNINAQADSSASLQAGQTVNIQADEVLTGGGSYASMVAGTVQLDGYVTVDQGGTPPSATSAQTPSVPAAPAKGTPSTGTPTAD